MGRCNTRSSSNHGIYFCGWVEIKPNDQYFTIRNYDASGTSGTCYIHLKAYRRIGYNNDSNNYLEKIKTSNLIEQNWTTAEKRMALPSHVGWRHAVYGDGKFVIVGTNGYSAVSSDTGRTWTSSEIGKGTGGFYGVAYGNNQFLAVQYNSDNVYSSSDGINWTFLDKLPTYLWHGICYGGGKFVALDNDGYVSTSTDGTSWTLAPQDLGSGYSWFDICYGNNKFVAIGAGGYISTSEDGLTWTSPVQKLDNSSSNNWYTITFGNGKFVALDNKGRIATSSDGDTWSSPSQELSSDCSWWGIAYGNEKFIAIDYDGYISTYDIYSLELGGKSHKGQWQNVQWQIVNGTFGSTEVKTVDLATYGIPDDDYTYRVIVSLYSVTPTTSGRACKFSVCPSHASYVQVLMVITRSSSNEIGRNTVQVDLLPHDRTLAICNRTDYATGSTIINITGYRRLGNNE